MGDLTEEPPACCRYQSLGRNRVPTGGEGNLGFAGDDQDRAGDALRRVPGDLESGVVRVGGAEDLKPAGQRAGAEASGSFGPLLRS